MGPGDKLADVDEVSEMAIWSLTSRGLDQSAVADIANAGSSAAPNCLVEAVIEAYISLTEKFNPKSHDVFEAARSGTII